MSGRVGVKCKTQLCRNQIYFGEEIYCEVCADIESEEE